MLLTDTPTKQQPDTQKPADTLETAHEFIRSSAITNSRLKQEIKRLIEEHVLPYKQTEDAKRKIRSEFAKPFIELDDLKRKLSVIDRWLRVYDRQDLKLKNDLQEMAAAFASIKISTKRVIKSHDEFENDMRVQTSSLSSGLVSMLKCQGCQGECSIHCFPVVNFKNKKGRALDSHE